MVDLQQRKRERLQVMNAIYDAADGRQEVIVPVEPIRLDLQMSDALPQRQPATEQLRRCGQALLG